MAAVIIRKKDLENLGRKLMKEVYKFLHDEYILSFEEMKLEKDKLEKNLVVFKFQSFNFTTTQKGNTLRIELEKEFKRIENEIKNESLDINLIFKVLNHLELDMKIDEDLYFKTKGFIHIFKVFDIDYTYLED